MSPPRPCPPAGRRRVVAALVAIALVALLGSAGCGADTADPPPSSTTAGPVATDPPRTAAPTSSTTTAAAVGGDEAEVRAVIDRYWDAWFTAAGNPPDPDNADLNAVLTGEAAIRIIGGIERRLQEGTYIRIPEGSDFFRVITSVEFGENGVATVGECVVDNAEVASIATGETVESGTSTLRLSTTLNRIPDEGPWVITSTTTTSKTEGVASCDV